MKLCWILQTLTICGGLERIETDKMNYLSAHGYDVSVICCNQSAKASNAFPLSEAVRQINLNRYFNPRMGLWKNPVAYLWSFIEYRRLLKDEVAYWLKKIGPDIVLMTTYHIPYIPVSAVYVLESHTHCKSNDVNWYQWNNIKRATKRSNVLVSLTHRDAEHWRPFSRVEVVPNYTDIKPVKPCNMSAKRVMAAGRLERQKGFDILIDSWARVSAGHPDWTLDIFGDGSLKGELQDRIDAMGLSGSVTLCPATSRIADEYAAHSVFVFSSRYEGFGLVLLEAMTCGMACVSFDCPAGPSDMIEDMVDGLLVEYERLSSKERVRRLSAAISYMIEHPDERERMAGAAIEKSRLFSRDKVMSRWDALFHSLVS